MLDFITNSISYLIFIYLLVYALYFLTLTIKSFSAKSYIDEQKSLLLSSNTKNKLCVIIWAHDKNKNLYNLLESLNNQSYGGENYDVHVIYKNSAINKKALPECILGAHIHNIENPDFFSKNKAINTFLEKIIQESKYDAFVFLGADRMIAENYLEIINRKIMPSTVLVGSLDIVDSERNLFAKIFAKALSAKAELTNNSINIARGAFELCQTIDGDNCVISSDIIEKAGRICFETRNEELKYSLFLASNELKPVYFPFVSTKIDVKNLDPTVPSFKQAFSLLKYYLPFLHKKPWYFIEYLASIFRPTTLFLLISYFALLYFSFTFKTAIEFRYVFHLGLFLLCIMITSIIASRISPLKIFYLLLSPIPLFVGKFVKLTKKVSAKLIKRQNEEDKNINSATINALVSNGKKDIMCKLDLVNVEGMRKIVFRYKKKRFESDEHLRMYDALVNITKSLKEKGFILKVCQNCANFTSDNDGTVDLLKGFCGEESILIWNCCPKFCFKKQDETQINF